MGIGREHLAQYYDFIASERRFSQATLATYGNAIDVFIDWKFGDGVVDFAGVSRRDLQDFIIEEQRRCKRTTVRNHASALRSLFRFLFENKKIPMDPSLHLVTPKLERRLPKIFTISQIKELLSAPEAAFARGEISREIALRDRMIFELFYGAGLRIGELRNIEIDAVDLAGCSLKVLGKRGKERLCPFSLAAKDAIEKYLAIRPHPSGSKLLEHGGKLLTAREIQYRLKFYLKFAALPADLSPHKIRHSFGTHMLNAGADLRLLQELLGHSSLSATQVYTRVDSSRMKNVHRNFHPRA
ncbi:MAG: tyrosine-type recombinase/integrase [Puniceicoccales bacterium]|nr:tyrosine-type recombinase/integrase [Puniceicoccales bacterium]